MTDEDLKLFLEDFLDYLNGKEAGIVKLKRQIEKLLGPEAPKSQSRPRDMIPEDVTFGLLTWEDAKGQRLGDYQIAHKRRNLPDKWNHAFAILRASNATIKNSYHSQGYVYHYWLYLEKDSERIFRKKLEAKA